MAETPEAKEIAPALNRMVISISALLGLCVALYMWAYATGLTGPVLCSVGDCEAVQASEFSRIGGIPVAAFGVAGYLALLVTGLMGLGPSFQHSRLISAILIGGGVAGVVFTGYLTYLEAYVIHAWCQWCLSSAIIMVVVFLGSLPELKRLRGVS